MGERGLGQEHWHVGEHTEPPSAVGVGESGQKSGGDNH